jgi:hypothetical protein
MLSKILKESLNWLLREDSASTSNLIKVFKWNPEISCRSRFLILQLDSMFSDLETDELIMTHSSLFICLV